jgi:hypothetical protein
MTPFERGFPELRFALSAFIDWSSLPVISMPTNGGLRHAPAGSRSNADRRPA